MAEASTSSRDPCLYPYRLNCELVGHEDQILAVDVFKNGDIVSASKDKTSRLWINDGGNYYEGVVMKGHDSEVCSVCVIEPSEKNPTGFIVTGGKGTKICIYYPGEENPIETMEAHTNLVCQLKASIFETECFFSCSSDSTGKLWDLYNLKKATAIFSGHEANSTVCCIADLDNGYVITGGSDKLVIVYKRDGAVLHRLLGHLDSVKDIAIRHSSLFITCSNDKEMRLWNAIEGVCLFVYKGHTKPLNSVASNRKGNLFVSCGEDRTFKIWSLEEIANTTFLPTKTVWSVKFLPNDDIVCGSSDEVVRIFTMDPIRFIDSESMSQYNYEVNKSHEVFGGDTPTHLTTTRENKSKLKKQKFDAKELEVPGEKDGDTIIIRKNSKIMVYRWSEESAKWKLVGDVMKGSSPSSGKPTYNGVEYDYVFSVDIRRNSPFLKLPYNKGQDPYEAAERFLEENSLSRSYLKKVAEFIITNVQINPIINATSQDQDENADGSVYVSNVWSELCSQIDKSKSCETKSYLPQLTYLKYEQGNLNAIEDKLEEFYSTYQDVMQNASPEIFKSLINLISSENSESIDEEVENLKSFLQWPDNIVFPILDIARLAVLQKNVNEKFCRCDIINTMKRHIEYNAFKSNQMLAFRLLTNLFNHDAGEKFCLENKDEVLSALTRYSTFETKNVQIAASTYILNLVVALNRTFDVMGKKQILNVVSRLLEIMNEPESLFRILVGIGTLIVGTSNIENRIKIVKSVLTLRPIVATLQKLTDEKQVVEQRKLYDVSKEIVKLLRSNLPSKRVCATV